MEGLPAHESGVFNYSEQELSASIELDVPAGKYWIIEFVSATLFLAKGDKFGPFEIWTSAPKLSDGTSRPHHFFLPQPVGNTDTRFCISQPTRIYSMPGSKVRIAFSRSSAHGNAHVMYTISGRLEDA